MSMVYGKATFRDGAESFLVHDDNEGWALQPLFESLDAAKEWVNSGCNRLEKTSPDSIMMAKFSEEPVHIIIATMDGSEPIQFHTTASKSGAVITGPQCKGDALGYWGTTYTKEYFDAWTPKSAGKGGCEQFDSLPPAKKQIIESVLEWWVDAQFLTMGDRGEWNVFDGAPEFVTMTMAIRSPGQEKDYERSYTTDQVAKLAVEWWKEFNNDDGGRNIIDGTPDFVRHSEKTVKSRI